MMEKVFPVVGKIVLIDKAISDRWWVSEGSTGDQKWAIAISVQKNWKSKIEGDVGAEKRSSVGN